MAISENTGCWSDALVLHDVTEIIDKTWLSLWAKDVQEFFVDSEY